MPTRNLINATTLTGMCTSNSIHLSSNRPLVSQSFPPFINPAFGHCPYHPSHHRARNSHRTLTLSLSHSLSSLAPIPHYPPSPPPPQSFQKAKRKKLRHHSRKQPKPIIPQVSKYITTNTPIHQIFSTPFRPRQTIHITQPKRGAGDSPSRRPQHPHHPAGLPKKAILVAIEIPAPQAGERGRAHRDRVERVQIDEEHDGDVDGEEGQVEGC